MKELPMALVLRELSDVIGNYRGLSRKVLDYTQLMKRMVDGAKQPGFTKDSWAPLQELIATDEFERIGNFKEVMSWQDYVNFLTGWAMSSEWECSFKRVTEQGNLVFLELEERSRIGDFSSTVNSATIYEFNAAGKLRHLDVFLQMALPSPEMLTSYEGVL
jgi:hypothetical protein